MRSIPTSLRVGARRTIPLHTPTPLGFTPRLAPSSARFSSTSTRAPPLLQLENARLRSLSPTNPFTWTIHDAGRDECWAIIAPASEAGGAVRRELVSILSGSHRPRISHSDRQHPPPHPFLLADAISASKAIKHVSFATKMGTTTAGNAGEFTNYAARYGAIRDQDRVTLYERLMELLDCPVGLIAAQKLVPDPFAPSTAGEVGLFKYSDSQRRAALAKAQEADSVIRKMAPLLLINDELLHRPVIALSNGQTRRARILSSLITGAQLVVLEEPFSGIDAGTRQRLGELFEQLHSAKRPRLVLVLREQDDVPDLVTHVLRVSDDGAITSIGPRSSTSTSDTTSSSGQGGPDVVAANAAAGLGRGDTAHPPLVALHNVSIAYGAKTVLDRISLSIHPGLRLVLAGDNGSGKTTLLALLLGDHPKSFSLGADSLTLFSHARDHPSNARALLNRRLGHLSPELFIAFPRKPLNGGGLTVGEVVASGFENIFARRTYTEQQKQRVWSLLAQFTDLLKTPAGTRITPDHQEDVQVVSGRGFAELSHGSQAVVLFLRAVVANPQLLVLDEPFQGMDAKQVQRTRAFLDHPERFLIGNTPEERQKDLEERKKIAIVLVSHYESEWPTSFGSLLRLSDGQVVQHI